MISINLRVDIRSPLRCRAARLRAVSFPGFPNNPPDLSGKDPFVSRPSSIVLDRLASEKQFQLLCRSPIDGPGQPTNCDTTMSFGGSWSSSQLTLHGSADGSLAVRCLHDHVREADISLVGRIDLSISTNRPIFPRTSKISLHFGGGVLYCVASHRSDHMLEKVCTFDKARGVDVCRH
jgi:hypothetical protein